MARHLGICVRCAKTKECLETSRGSMCPGCFHTALRNPDADSIRLHSFPEKGQKVFVVKETPLVYLTVNGVLYAFDRKDDAERFAAAFRDGYGIHAKVYEEDAEDPLRYVMANPDLTLTGVKEVRLNDGRPRGEDEIAGPAL